MCFLFTIRSLITKKPSKTITIPTRNSSDNAIVSGIVIFKVKMIKPAIMSVVVCPIPHIAPRIDAFFRFLCFDIIDVTATT